MRQAWILLLQFDAQGDVGMESVRLFSLRAKKEAMRIAFEHARLSQGRVNRGQSQDGRYVYWIGHPPAGTLDGTRFYANLYRRPIEGG